MAEFKLKRHDRARSFLITCKLDGVAVDFSAFNGGQATTPIFNMRRVSDGAVIINRATAVFNVTNGTDGVIRYDWAAADVQTAGTYQAEVQVLDAGGLPQTWPGANEFVTVIIGEDIDDQGP